MEFDFTQAMQNETDENLIKIVTVDRDGYQPAAVIAAETALAKRNISTATFEATKKDHEEIRKAVTERANAPLDKTTKIVVFFIPFIHWMLSRTLRRDGYDRKAAEVVKWSMAGIVCYLVAIFLLNSFF